MIEGEGPEDREIQRVMAQYGLGGEITSDTRIFVFQPIIKLLNGIEAKQKAVGVI